MRVWLAQVSLLPEMLGAGVGPWELPALAARHGFSSVEWLDRLLPSCDHVTLARLGEACRQAGLGPGGLSLSIQHQAKPARLGQQTQRALGLLEACPALGVEFVRVALGGGGLSVNGVLESLAALRPPRFRRSTPLGLAGRAAYRLMAAAGLTRDQRHASQPPPASEREQRLAVRALAPLAQRASELGLRLGVENHWGLSGRPADLLGLVYNLERYNVGICLDLDNFYRDQDSLAGVAALAPSALHVHYKARARDAAGEARRLDYRAKLGVLKAEEYNGSFSVEYEGPAPRLGGAARAAGVLRELWESCL
jgi:sugar phosphate isomerase/epimerase